MAQRKGGPKTQDVMADTDVQMPLQAILLADSFAQKFRPITLERPKVLLPLVNVPMIEYTLEWLASAGVEQVFVLCCAHAEQVIKFLEISKWRSQPRFAVTVIESHDCVSVGDALRRIEQQNVIRGDFVLVSGDTVSNMSLKDVLWQHQERRKKDKLAIMTMVIQHTKVSSLTHQSRLGDDELVFAIDKETKQLLYYDSIKDYPTKEASQKQPNKPITLDRTILTDRAGVELYLNVQDCHIDICSPEVLFLFTDNFDYQQVRRDFVKGLLSEEIMGNKVFTFKIDGEYAARIDNFRAYDTVSKDIIQRWTYPLVPDIQFSHILPSAKWGRHNVYKEPGVTIDRTALVGENTVIGEGSKIGENSRVRHSVIGRGCSIGKNVTIEGCYIWNNVTVGDDAHLLYSILCDGAVVRTGAKLKPGAILSFKTIIGPSFVVPSYSKISLMQQPTEEGSSDEELEYADSASSVADKQSLSFSDQNSDSLDANMHDPLQHWDPAEVGHHGAGYKWINKEPGQDDELRHSVAPLPAERLQEMAIRHEQNSINGIEQEPDVISGGESIPSASADVDEEEEEPDEENEKIYFEREVEETFRRAVSENSAVKPDHVVLEVNALKLAYDKSFSDCGGAMFKAILNLACEMPHSSSVDLLTNTRNVISKWSSLLQRFIKSEDDQVEIVLQFEEMCEEGSELAPLFSAILAELYDKEIITEEAILVWESDKKGAEESEKVFLNQSQKFIQWLKEASEEEDEDEDE